MIYTSYFGRVKSLPYDVIPIAICGKAPEWWSGLIYKKLAPPYSTFANYKRDGNWEQYVKEYNEKLSGMNPKDVISELCLLADIDNTKDSSIALLCYEKPGDNCHRHLVANWFKEAGIMCEEYNIYN